MRVMLLIHQNDFGKDNNSDDVFGLSLIVLIHESKFPQS